MEWFAKINSAIDYIEHNIKGRVDYEQAAQIACCSLSHFQNMFLFLTDITPSEYVKKRKMTLAAHELLNSYITITDLSFRYGYESPEAFTRSFKSFHGISPSEVRKTGKINDYSRLSFHLKILGGHMGTDTQLTVYKNIVVKVNYLILEESFKFIGLGNKNLEPFENIGIFKENHKNKINNNVDDNENMDFGMFTNLPNGTDWDYYYGVQVKDLDNIPTGLTGFDTQTKRFAVMSVGANSMFELVGDETGPSDAMMTAEEYTKNIWLPEHKDIAILDENGDFGKVLVDGKIYHTGCFEAYPKNCGEAIEMQFYIPLK
jgi:AraC-like DNA-binding protein